MPQKIYPGLTHPETSFRFEWMAFPHQVWSSDDTTLHRTLLIDIHLSRVDMYGSRANR